MNDAQFERQMLRRLAGEMSEAELLAFMEAVRLDPALCRRWALWEGVWEGAAEAHKLPSGDLQAPPGLRTRVVARAAQEAAGQRQMAWLGAPGGPRAGGPRAGVLASAALALVLGVALGMRLVPAPRVTAVEATVMATDAAGPQAGEIASGAELPTAEPAPGTEGHDRLAESSLEDLGLLDEGFGEAGLAALEGLFDEADPS
jgi:hypothetical protein